MVFQGVKNGGAYAITRDISFVQHIEFDDVEKLCLIGLGNVLLGMKCNGFFTVFTMKVGGDDV